MRVIIALLAVAIILLTVNVIGERNEQHHLIFIPSPQIAPLPDLIKDEPIARPSIKKADRLPKPKPKPKARKPQPGQVIILKPLR